MMIYFLYMFLGFTLELTISMWMFLSDQGLVMEWLVMSLNSLNLEMLIYLDWISVLFVGVVKLISSMILIYSSVYMKLDKFIYRYNYLVLLFVFSMMLVILSPNMVSILLGWDGLGLVSYCLVIYYQNYLSYNSGMLTVLLNRVGDVLILMVIGIMFIYGSWNMFMLKKMSFLMVLIILASMTKSAQMPFSSWLPSAMAAPTPVSALVHSSTLVTAGVYLLIRFNKFLVMEEGGSKILLMLSVLTMFMSGLMANFENDLKKIIALSTLSQLGLMMMILSFGFPLLAFYHLLTHAIFKSLLFMGAGIMIHLMNNNQDIRFMGGLSEYIPFTMMSFHLSAYSLCGFPFMSGFYSKDLIMEMIYVNKFNLLMFIMSLISLMFTVMYSVRLSYYLFFLEKKFLGMNSFNEDKLMNCSMMILMGFSIVFGSALNWMFFMEFIFLKLEVKMLTMMMMILGVFFALVFSLFNLLKLYNLSFFCSSMWFMNYLFIFMIKPTLIFVYNLYINDKMWMEFYSKSFFFNSMKEFGNNVMSYKYKIFMFLYWFILMVYFYQVV